MRAFLEQPLEGLVHAPGDGQGGHQPGQLQCLLDASSNAGYLEEAPPLQAACAAEGLALVQLVAPTSPEERVARLARETEGFLYVVSRLGTTGVAQGPAADLADRLATIRRHARTPVAVGFGVSAPEAVRQVAALADGVVVGSAIVERAAEGPKALEGYVANLCSFLTRA